MDDRLYWIWMQRAFVPGSLKADALLRGFGTARAVYEASVHELAPFELSKAEHDRLAGKSLDSARAVLNLALKQGGWVLTPEDGLYPSLLRSIPGVPLVLYGYGELPDLDIIPAIAIVGTRATTGYGRRVTALLAGGLALGGAVIISGGACGVDAAAHEAALAAGGQTVAVQGCGLDVPYPSQNIELRMKIARSGAVVSEFPPGTPPLRHHFPLRNRIISGMALGVCVTEAPERSGALITARLAFEQGRDVFAVAGDMLTGRSAGTDELIRQGARLVTGAAEILEEYCPRFPDILNPEAAGGVRRDPRFRTHPSPGGDGRLLKHDREQQIPESNPEPDSPDRAPRREECPASLSGGAQAVFARLGDTPKTMGDLIAASGLQAPQVLTALTELEIGGYVKCNPGQVYVKR